MAARRGLTKAAKWAEMTAVKSVFHWVAEMVALLAAMRAAWKAAM